jgi:hypothetical protein
MKTILSAILFVASSMTYAQSAKPPSCDDLKGMEKEACLKKGGTVKANTAAGGSSTPSKEKIRKDYRKDYQKPAAK